MLWGPIGSRDASCAHSPAESAAKHTAQGVGLWKCELLARCSHFLQGYFMIALTFTQVDDDKHVECGDRAELGRGFRLPSASALRSSSSAEPPEPHLRGNARDC
eukprot:scaffold298997_cov35-Tisochrysis_lutea.AAC.1